MGAAEPGKRLGEYLDERGMTQTGLARRLGTTPQYVSALIAGRKSASTRRWAEIAELLGIDVAVLFGAEQADAERVVGELDERVRRLELLESVKPGATPPPDTEPGAALLLADEALQRALGVYPLSDDDRIFAGGLRLAGRCTEAADAAAWVKRFRAWQAWVAQGEPA